MPSQPASRQLTGPWLDNRALLAVQTAQYLAFSHRDFLHILGPPGWSSTARIPGKPCRARLAQNLERRSSLFPVSMSMCDALNQQMRPRLRVLGQSVSMDLPHRCVRLMAAAA